MSWLRQDNCRPSRPRPTDSCRRVRQTRSRNSIVEYPVTVPHTRRSTALDRTLPVTAPPTRLEWQSFPRGWSRRGRANLSLSSHHHEASERSEGELLAMRQGTFISGSPDTSPGLVRLVRFFVRREGSLEMLSTAMSSSSRALYWTDRNVESQ